MKELLDNISNIFIKNGLNDLNNSVEEKKLLYLYCFYHYYFGDDDRLEDIVDHCSYSKAYSNFAQGFFEQENYEEKIIDVLVPYYINDISDFNFDYVKYMISQTQAMIGQMKNKTFSLSASQSKLGDYWDPSSDDKLVIRVLTNYKPKYDEKNKIQNNISNISPLFSKLCFEIIFGDDIEDEIAQLISDKQYVDNGELTLDKPNNFLTYGEEESIITNVKASSIRDNYQKYSKAGLFAMNLRFYIADKKVDKGLEESIRCKGENFWYYNNGIIIVCDDFKIEGDKIKLKNFSIVNGGQTTRMIGYIPFERDFAVSCKIIRNKYKINLEENTKFVSEIAEASNSQKKINSTDLIANRYEQRYLKNKLAENNIFMQIKRGDAAIAKLKENYPAAWQRTKNDELGQLLYATIYQKPGTARNGKEKIFSDKNKYKLVFGSPATYNIDLIKDLLFLKTYYKKWASKISKDFDADEIKKGLAKNGLFYFSAAVMLIAKFAFSKDLINNLKTIGFNTEKGNHIVSQKTFNHRIFNDDYEKIEKKIFALFNLVYDKYIGKEFMRLKMEKPELVYSNYTKTDKNYSINIASSIFDDFAYEINGRVLEIITSLFYTPTNEDEIETSSLVMEAIENYNNPAKKEDDDIIDSIEEDLKEKLLEFRTHTSIENNIKENEIFTKEELKKLVTLCPKTSLELLEWNCFKNHPRRKIRNYGKQIIEIIVNVCGVQNK